MTIAAPVSNTEIVTSADEFATYLQERALLDEVSLHRALAAQGKSGERLTVVLSRLGLMAETDLARALADHLSLGVAERKDIPEEPILADRLQPGFLRSKQVLPLSFSDGRLALAMVDPTDEEVCRAAEYHLDCKINRLVLAPADFSWGWERLYGASDQKPALLHSGEDLASLDVARLKELASEAPTIRLVNQLFNEAVEAGASDIHIEPFETSLVVRIRIDGRLHQVRSLPISQAAAIVSRVKIVAGLDISERRLPQDGRVRTSVRGVEIDLRVSCIPNLHGEGLVIRLLDRRGLDLSLSALGLPERTSRDVQSILQEPSGIVLVTGPTGSGKTTTLYAMLSLLNEPRRKIITVEDPVEYRFAGINQVQVHPAIGLDFAASLRAILRHDPDVVMVGEIRDSETARIAVQASLTGHLVLSTVHTNNATATLTRLMDMGVEDYLLASTLKGVLAQRLVRKLCSHCSVEADSQEQFQALAENVSLPLGQATLKKPVGCPQCRGTGYSGRTTVSEFLKITPAIREHIRSRALESVVTQDAAAAGMRPQRSWRRSMYLPVPPQPDCASAWREAVRLVDGQPGHAAYNVIIDVADPVANATLADARIAVVDEFLSGYDKSVETVANTIFPAGLYRRYGAPEFFGVFLDTVLKKVRRTERWSGYYFERMVQYPTPSGEPPNQLWDIVKRLRDEDVSALNKYELSLFDPGRDVDNSPYGGQCLSFMSFKVIPGAKKTLTLTAMYRNHFYIEKLLGNLVGLGRLMDFVAGETGLKIGALTVISTHAEIDQPKRSGKAATRSEIGQLIASFDQAAAPLAA